MQATLPGPITLPSPPTGAGPRRHRFLRYGVPIALVLLLLAALVGIKASQIAALMRFGRAAEAAGPPPEAIATSAARTDSWHRILSAVGSVEASRGVAVSNEVAGTVAAIRFVSGSNVRQGDVLVELDTTVERAQLAAALARRDLASVTARRTRALLASNAVAPAQADTDDAALASASADASALQAQVARKVVRAPFTGRIGIREVNVGQYLSPGTRVAVLESSDEQYVDFTLPQGALRETAVGGRVDVGLQGNGDTTLPGKIVALDPSLDQATRSLRVRASVKDPDKRLRPGMFVSVTVVLAGDDHVVLAPTTAVIHAPYGDSVFVVEATQKGDVAHQVFVRTGETRGDFVSITDGLGGGESLVVAGAFKLHNGSPVRVNDEGTATPEIAPHPTNR